MDITSRSPVLTILTQKTPTFVDFSIDDPRRRSLRSQAAEATPSS
ncbi:hypothetical protein [Halocatena salina]|nr:hypothetical protein [Halocatena salina]